MNDKQKTLKDLVPPLELCEQAAEIVGNGTALVWEVYRYQYGVDPYVMSRETSETTRGSAVESVFPAPTLAELLEMINKTSGTHPTVEAHEHDTWRVRAFTPGMLMWERDENPATAALRLLMRVKGATK